MEPTDNKLLAQVRAWTAKGSCDIPTALFQAKPIQCRERDEGSDAEGIRLLEPCCTIHRHCGIIRPRRKAITDATDTFPRIRTELQPLPQ
jgi:hypothetical protein